MSSYQSWLRWIPVIFVLIWSTGFIAAKFALPYIEPYTLLFLRKLITLALIELLVRPFKAMRMLFGMKPKKRKAEEA